MTRPGASFASRVVAWQAQHGRHGLPWQGSRDAYCVWLSEIMLQQTQVTTVLAFYPRFLARFADVASLAAAALDDVLALWSGMGYYSRARNLHRCAQVVMRQHGGQFPRSAAALAELPGIGPSTAAAIAAFCFDERAAILDGNVKRVLARHAGFAQDLANPAALRELWQMARHRLPAQAQMVAYTQGLMDLGATRCTARQPQCGECPVSSDCVARLLGQAEHLPIKSRRSPRGVRSNALLWLEHRDGLWLVQRPASGVWGGLWSLPEFEHADAALEVLADAPGECERLPPVRHVLTHFDWHLQVLRWRLPARLDAAGWARLQAALGEQAVWLPRAQALARGLPAPVRSVLSQDN